MFDDESKPIWWLPTVGFFLFLSFQLWMFAGPDKIFEDPGVGRHLRSSQFILETGQIPRTDSLSFSHAGEPWMDFEWAFETTLGVLTRVGGLGLVAAFCVALFATTILGVYRTLLQSGLSATVVLLYTGLAFLTLRLHFSVRPVLFTYLLMALVVEVWFRRVQPLRRDWFFLPLIFVAWANLHAGWLAALVFLFISMTGRLFDRLSGRVTGEEAPLIPWLGLTILCTLATSINPWGWGLHRQLFLFATSYKSFVLWDEYKQPDFNLPTMSAITILLLLLIVVGARVSRRGLAWRWETFLPFFFFLYESLKAQRHALLLVEIAAVPVARDMGAILHAIWWPSFTERLRRYFVERLKLFQDNQRLAGGDAWLALVSALILTTLFVRTPIAHQIAVGTGVTANSVAFIRDHPDRFQRPVTTAWNAGPLLWNLRPNFRVSFDDRGDFYGDKTVFKFVSMTDGGSDWRETLEAGHYDSAILESYLQLTQLLPLTPGWKEVYRDKKTVIFWKEDLR